MAAAAAPVPVPAFEKGTSIELTAGTCHYKLHGVPTADHALVVMLHGINAGLFVFDELASTLATEGRQVLCFDFYGRGHSSMTAFDHHGELFVSQLVELLLMLGPATNFASTRPIDLLGVSMGGAVAGFFASKFPQLVHKLVLIAPAGLPVAMPFVGKLAMLPGLGEAAIALAARGGHLADSAKGAYVDLTDARNAAAMARMQAYVNYQLAHNPQYTKAILSTVRNFPLSTLEPAFTRLGPHRYPVLVVWGTQDAIVPFANQARLCNLIPRATTLVIEACGHTEMFAKFFSELHPKVVTFLDY